jgi:hypothetical protein
MSLFFPSPPSSDNPIQFPHVSKIKVRKAELNPVIQSLTENNDLHFQNVNEEHIADKKLKPLTKFQRPSFSPKLNSWMTDLVFYSRTKVNIQIYMFIINVNTRFLVVYPIPNRSTTEIFKVLDKYINDF